MKRSTPRCYAERDSSLEVCINSHSWEIKEWGKEREKDCRNQRAWRAPGEHGPLKLGRVHIVPQTLKWEGKTLNSESRFTSDSFACSFAPIGLPCLLSTGGLLTCLMVVCFVLLCLLLDGCSFLRRKWMGSGYEEERRWEGDRSQGRRNCDWDVFYEKRIFERKKASKRKKVRKKKRK